MSRMPVGQLYYWNKVIIIKSRLPARASPLQSPESRVQTRVGKITFHLLHYSVIFAVITCFSEEFSKGSCDRCRILPLLPVSLRSRKAMTFWSNDVITMKWGGGLLIVSGGGITNW